LVGDYVTSKHETYIPGVIQTVRSHNDDVRGANAMMRSNNALLQFWSELSKEDVSGAEEKL